MKNIVILAAVLLAALYYIIAEVIRKLRDRIFRRRFVIGVLIAALLLSQIDIMSIFMKTDAETVSAAEYAESNAETGINAEAAEIVNKTISAFNKLQGDIIEQTVPIGTKLTELVLPDTLEAVCVETDSNKESDIESDADENPGDSSENADNTGDVTPDEETATEDEAPENGPKDDTQDDSQAEEENGNAEDEEEDDNLIEEEQSPEGNDTEESKEESEEETIETDTETFTESTKDAAMQTETVFVSMPEYRSENVIEIKTLEDDLPAEEADSESDVINDEQPAEDSENETDADTSEISQETIIIENITWQSEPEYDGDTEGEYIFTAVLPEGYVLTNGVNTPRITVTVGGTNNIMLLSDDGSKDDWPRNPYKKEPDDLYMTLDCVYFGHYWYHDTNSDDEVDQSDKKEPIKWQVLSVDESGDAFLLADKIVDVQPYNKTNKRDVTWETCTLRSWLNGYGSGANGENEDYSGDGMSFFDNAFSEEEKSAILETEVENGDDPDEEGTRDKVYLLSISEVTNPNYGFSASKSSSYYPRSAYSTEYARSAPWVFAEHWYLRSMADQGGYSDPAAALIDDDGKVYDKHKGYSIDDAIGVRPVLHLNLNKDVWVPACPVQGKNRVLHRSFGPWHSHPWWEDYHEHICADETCVRLDPYNSSANEPCSGGTAGYTKKAICAVCGNEYGALLTDDTPPTGTISIDTDQWDDVLTDFTFERFYKESKDVTISAEDGESGVASISYYLTDSELKKDDLNAIEDWLLTGADYEEEDDWQAADTVTVTVNPDKKCILYAKIVDGMGNTTYLSTDGMVLDVTAPKIEGVKNGGTYCAPQDVTVTVTDDYLDSVTLNGESVALSADGTSCTFTLSEAEPSLTIEAADKAGNTATVTVTVNKDHTFGDWEESTGTNRSKTCENCGQKYTETDEERLKAAKEIVEEFLENLSAPEDMGADELRQMVEDKLAREGFSDVTVTMDEFHKEESSGQAEGKVWGDVTLELREASEDVVFDIPLTNDRQRVQRAKEVVEKTLSEMTVSNDTTAEDIQEAIDAALKDAGLEDVTATVGDDFNIKKATEESEGQITGTVTLEKGKETDKAEIDKKIDKLEQTSSKTPEKTPEATVDREGGKITGLVPGAEYDITYTDESGNPHTDKVKADENGNLDIEDDWTGGNIDIVKKGDGTTTDSDKQTLRIPEKEKKPTPKTTKVSAKGKSDGKITNLEPNETYEISSDGGKTWETRTADGKGEITGLPAGSYKIRTKAKDDANGGTLCSDAADCKIGTKSSSNGSGGSSGSGGGNDNSGSSSGSGGDDNSGGQSNDDGGNSQTDNTTPDTVTPPTDTNTPETGTPSTDTPKTKTPKKETSKEEEPKQDTDKKAENSGKSEQSTKPDTNPDTKPSGETAEQTAPMDTENDGVKITGDIVSTGTIKDAQDTTTTLTVGEGSVSVTVVSDEYRYAAGVADTVAVANAVLTQEQIGLVNNGEKIEVRVEVKDISEQVSKEDKDIIENGLTAGGIDGEETEKLTLGAYIDISMFIKIGDGDWNAVTQSGEPIDVVIGIPDELQTDGRTFYIARCHEGEYALLNDMDTDAETITIQTALFSTYAIVYRQIPVAGADASSGFFASLSWMSIALWSLGILVIIALAVILIVSKRRKQE